jgi:hypothetical protein
MTAVKLKARIDSTVLVTIFNQCFDLSMDGRLKPKRRKEFLALGKRLRGSLVNLPTATFDASSQQFKDASSEIDKVNKSLKATTQKIDQAAATMGEPGGACAASRRSAQDCEWPYIGSSSPAKPSS